jgi:hypothetical protein
MNILFVQIVEKIPCLYDHKLSEHSRRNVTENALTKMEKEMNKNQENISSSSLEIHWRVRK